MYQIVLLGDRGTRVWAANCRRPLPVSGLAEIRTRDLLGRERMFYRYATQATEAYNITIVLRLQTSSHRPT